MSDRQDEADAGGRRRGGAGRVPRRRRRRARSSPRASRRCDLDGKRVLVIIPDGTRTMPMPLMFGIARGGARPARGRARLPRRARHAPADDRRAAEPPGRAAGRGRARSARSRIFNHRWDDPARFATLGTIPAAEIRELTGGLLEQDVAGRAQPADLRLRPAAHLRPGVPARGGRASPAATSTSSRASPGPEIINFTHWLGALITQLPRDRRRLHAGARRDRPRGAASSTGRVACLALVVTHAGVAGPLRRLAGGRLGRRPRRSRRRRTSSTSTRPFRRVLSVMPAMYDDLWTAAKGMYKLEPAVADGGEVVIYAPHITEVSYTHGALIDEIGYHCRDYFLGAVGALPRLPGRRAGALDAREGPRHVRRGDRRRDAAHPGDAGHGHSARSAAAGSTSATWTRPAIGVDDWQGREAEGVLVVPRAGEMLYRLAP